MKAIGRNLYKRNKTLYYRSALPRKLHNLLPHKELVFSLGIDDIHEARVLCAQINAKEYSYIQKFRTEIRKNPSSNICINELINALQDLKASYSVKTHTLAAHNSIQISQLKFLEVSQLYLEDCITDAFRTKFQKEKTFQIFIELIGNKTFSQISKDDTQLFKRLLTKIPANAKKKLKLNSLSDIDWQKYEGEKPQSFKTINNRLAYLVTLFNWAIEKEYYHRENPFQGLLIKAIKSQSKKRPSFTTKEITHLFTCPIYTGSEGHKWSQRLSRGNHIYKDSLYWIPLIGLYSGMRLNEICQLYSSDILEENGIFYFHVGTNHSDQQIKNSSSNRKVPIHDEIIKRGFLEYVKTQETKRVFPDIVQSSHENYSLNFSKKFARMLKFLDLHHNGLCYHSLRHTFIDGLRNNGVERHIAMLLAGHHSRKDTHDHYGHGYTIQIMSDNMNKLTYPEIE